MDEILNKIHTKGFWRVNIRPTNFKKQLIPNLSKCWEIIEDSVVLLRGWDYPHLDHKNRINGNDWIASYVDFRGHIEYWRFYQSGQFIHHFACREDYELDESDLSPLSIPSPSPSGNYLSILSTLYTLTEIFQFASRLCIKNILLPSVEIRIDLFDMKDRQLFFWDHSRYLSTPKICKMDKISYSNAYSPNDLINNAPDLAREVAVYIYERFNWNNLSKKIFSEEQRKLIERRL